METMHLKGKQLAGFDRRLASHLGLRPGNPRRLERQRMRIGIRNECGELYRVIATSNISEYMSALDRLLAMGFVDEYADGAPAVREYDALLRPLGMTA